MLRCKKCARQGMENERNEGGSDSRRAMEKNKRRP
jgi:hypothetical protein